jgi:DNA-binding MarR family transcriptional regulator
MSATEPVEPELETAAGDQPAVDLGPLPGLVGYMLRRAQLAVFQDFNRCFADAGIRPAEYGALTVIAHNPGLKQSTVGDALGIQRSNLVALIERLRRRKLIHRRAAADDRRAYALTLSAEGAVLLEKLDRIRAEHEARLIEQVGPERIQEFLGMLQDLSTLNEA